MPDHFQRHFDYLGKSSKLMSGNHDPALDGELPSKAWATPESSMEVVPSRGGRSLTPKLPVIPKGKFTNFDEAHQAITARLAAPRSASNNSNNSNHVATPSLGSVESVPSSLDVLTSSSRPSDLVPTDQHMELARVDHHVNGRSLTAPYNNLFSGSRPDDQCPKSSLAPPNATLPAFPDGLGRGTDNSQKSIEESLVSRAPRETGSTVENIYKQYLPSESPSSSSELAKDNTADGSPPRLESPPASPNDDDNSDKNYKLESSEGLQMPKVRKTNNGFVLEKNRHQMYPPPSQAPQIPLPELPSEKLDLYRQSEKPAPPEDDNTISGPSATTMSDSQILLNGVLNTPDRDESLQYHADESDIHGPALYSSHDGADHEYEAANGRPFIDRVQHLLPGDFHTRGSFDDISNRGPSSGAFTSESDDDPFKYDRGSYNVFLRPMREREVSAALHQIGSPPNTPHKVANRASSPGRDSPPSPTPKPGVPPVPALPPRFAIQAQNGSKTTDNKLFKQENLNYYQSSTASQAVATNKAPNEIKIKVHQRQNPSVQTVPGPESQGLASRLEVPNEDQIGLRIIHSVNDGDAGDWETVGTNVGHFDSNRFDSNRACASGSTFSNDFRIIKTTGSSIAGHSEDEFMAPSFGHKSFDSGDRILQHPMPGNIPATQHLRTLKDTGRPIFVPKPRFHQVNGYLQNSVRTLTGQNSASTGSSTTRYLADKLTAPFRSDSFNRKRQDWSNPYNNIEQPRFDIRDSFGSAGSLNLYRNNTGTSTVWKDEAELDEQHSDADPGPERSRYARANQENLQSPIADSSFFTTTKNDGSPDPASSVQFSFPLIPLPEAVKLEALRRASGEDISFVSTNRTRKNSSLASSRATQKTTPTTLPAIKRPPPTHQPRPVTAFGFHDDTQSTIRASTIRAVGDSTSSPLYAAGRMIPDVSTGTLPGPGHHVFPSSVRNPFSSVNGSVASSSTTQLPGPSPHLWPRGTRRQYRQPGPNRAVDLQGIVDLDQGAGFVLINEDASLSWEARTRREHYYYAVCALCILPFFALLVYRNKASAALSWYTKGETCTLNTRQQRNALRVAKASAVFWICAFAVLITVVVTQNTQKKH